MITTIICLSIVVVVLLYTTINLLIKIEKAEDMIISRDNWIQKFQEMIEFSDNKLKEIDEKGTFKSDDEIGWFFNQIKTIQNMLNDYKI